MPTPRAPAPPPPPRRPRPERPGKRTTPPLATRRTWPAGARGQATVCPQSDADENKDKTSWIELQLVYESNGLPVVGMPYEVTLPDGRTVAGGPTDDKGLARVDHIDPARARSVFPRWTRKLGKTRNSSRTAMILHVLSSRSTLPTTPAAAQTTAARRSPSVRTTAS